MRLRVAAANDEIVGEDRLGVDIESEDIDALLIEQGIDQHLSQFQTFQKAPSYDGKFEPNCSPNNPG